MPILPNIYNYKNLKVLIAIPLILMLLGIYFSTQIVYDTSLKGGVSIILQTNSTASTSSLASAISSKFGAEAPSVAASPGGIQITLSMNQSLSDAEASLTAFYAQEANYSSYVLNSTNLGFELQRDRGNATLMQEIQQSNAASNASMTSMRSTLKSELAALKPFGASSVVNASGVAQLQAAAQGAYTNASGEYESNVISTLHSIVDFSSFSYQQVSPTLGSFFLSQLTDTMIMAFILIFIAVLVIFRSPVPAAIVVFGAANDIVVALGAMGLFKIPLGVPSIAGLLMLIGYSIDTDVLTATRILRRGEGKAEDRAYASMKTGITMTATAVVSFGALFAISVIAYVPTYYEIAGVVLVGLVGDVITTWFGNAALVLLYKKRKDRL